MKKSYLLLILIFLCSQLFGCGSDREAIQVAATTLPVYEFAEFLCQDTDISVVRLVTEDISCLHNYTLQTRQMKHMERADLIVISGAGLESFLDDALNNTAKIADASKGIVLHCSDEDHAHDHTDGHHHTSDPHIWLSPQNAAIMADNICNALSNSYPQYAETFAKNSLLLSQKLKDLADYANSQLKDLSCRQIITFHDGFSYMAESFDLEIVQAIEEESGSEASAQEIISLIHILEDHELPAIFVEKNNPGSAAAIIAEETDTEVFQLDMALSGKSYFTAMYNNIDTLKEALK